MNVPPIELLPGVPLPLLRGETHPCPYVPGRTASELYALSSRMDGETYQLLMDHGFRRSADLFYRPSCPECTDCVPIRVPVEEFACSRSQERVMRRNADVSIEINRPRASADHWRLFREYQNARHGGEMLGSRAAFAAALCRSSIATMQMEYRLGSRLLGVGIVDFTPLAMSSVYFYFDPAESRRSLGVFSSLCEIAEARRRALRWWYSGFWIAGCRKMEYKRAFRPYELLDPAGEWRRIEQA